MHSIVVCVTAEVLDLQLLKHASKSEFFTWSRDTTDPRKCGTLRGPFVTLEDAEKGLEAVFYALKLQVISSRLEFDEAFVKITDSNWNAMVVEQGRSLVDCNELIVDRAASAGTIASTDDRLFSAHQLNSDRRARSFEK
jgi:hypothetical protein